MNRTNPGEHKVLVHRWGRPILSCRPCRDKKRRCDRQLPCANCKLRGVQCVYPPRSGFGEATSETRPRVTPRPSPDPAQSRRGRELGNKKDILDRLERLESAVLGSSTTSSLTPDESSSSPSFTNFASHDSSSHNANDAASYLAQIVSRLPPIEEARTLFEHYARTLHQNLGILHLRSARDLLQQTYDDIHSDDDPDLGNILLLFSIFAGGAFFWTPKFLEKLNASQGTARAASQAYHGLAMSLLENTTCPIQPSTTTIVAISVLANVSINSRGLPGQTLVLHQKCLGFMRFLGLDGLDSRQSLENRARHGCNMIELELQRRVWWNLVRFDWMAAFSGSPYDGTYSFQPKHFNVNYPSNVDDDQLQANGPCQDLPLYIPTSMSAFIYRLKMAEVCRRVIDQLPSFFSDEKPSYDSIIALDQEFTDYLNGLPAFLRMDGESIKNSEGVCQERPTMAFHRISTHFSVQTRICRLHRPYHLDGFTNPAYAHSTQACRRAANSVLDLRRQMEGCELNSGLSPARSWIVMQHVYVAALILATDVSFDPTSPDAEARKAKVLGACETLERSTKESGALMEGVQRNMQVLVDTLQRKVSSNDAGFESQGHAAVSSAFDEGVMASAPCGSEDTFDADLPTSGVDGGNWDQLWTDFYTIAPDLDMPQWDMLLDDINMG